MARRWRGTSSAGSRPSGICLKLKGEAGNSEDQEMWIAPFHRLRIVDINNRTSQCSQGDRPIEVLTRLVGLRRGKVARRPPYSASRVRIEFDRLSWYQTIAHDSPEPPLLCKEVKNTS